MASNVGAQMARKMDRMGDELRRSKRVAVQGGAMAVTTEVRQQLKQDVPSGRLKGARNAKVSVGFDMKGDDRAEVKARGPWQLFNNPTKAHEVKPKGAGPRRRGSGKKAVAFNGIARASAQHPGTRGKKTWEQGVAAGKPKAAKELRNVTTNAVKRGMRA